LSCSPNGFQSFYLFVFLVLGFELPASHLLGRFCTT
jgi:hypothetical protein